MILDRMPDFNCTNVCVPLWIEPILDTIDHNYENCENPKDYYCMYSSEVEDIVVALAPESLKSCVMKSPKIKQIMGVNQIGAMFTIIVDLVGTRNLKIEYLIYDALSLIGTIGGTLGLFVGFSFYNLIAFVIDLLFDKLKIK